MNINIKLFRPNSALLHSKGDIFAKANITEKRAAIESEASYTGEWALSKGDIFAKANITEGRAAIESESAHIGESSLRERLLQRKTLLRRERKPSDLL
jgi:hypothetical protein